MKFGNDILYSPEGEKENIQKKLESLLGVSSVRVMISFHEHGDAESTLTLHLGGGEKDLINYLLNLEKAK